MSGFPELRVDGRYINLYICIIIGGDSEVQLQPEDLKCPDCERETLGLLKRTSLKVRYLHCIDF